LKEAIVKQFKDSMKKQAKTAVKADPKAKK
jgi:hypothetical protein